MRINEHGMLAVRRHAATVAWLVLSLGLLAILISGFIIPWVNVFDSRDWRAVPCVIVSSGVVRYSGRYMESITYRYEVAGRVYQSSRVRFSPLHLTHRFASDIVGQYPPGKQAICYVDPDNPGEAVLNRGFVPSLLRQATPALILMIFTCGACLVTMGSIFDALTP